MAAVQLSPRPAPATTPSPQHIVFVCLVFHPDSSASSLLFTDLFRRLAGDVRVTVLCGFPSKDRALQLETLPRRETVGGVDLVRCGVRMRGKKSLLTRAVAYGSFLAHAGWHLLRLEQEAIVVGSTDPPFTPIALWLTSHLRRFEYQLVLLDLYPDGLLALGKLRSRSPLTHLWRALNRISYARAEQLTVIGRDMATLLQRRYAVDPLRITYIPHWAPEEVDRLDVAGAGTLLSLLGLQGKFVVQYSGNMGLWHDMHTLVRAAERLRDDKRIHFLFIGQGMRRRSAEQLSDELGLTNITWLDFLPREELSRSLAACDVALISLRQGLAGVAVPSKLYGILASGRPVIAQVPLDSEVARVVREERCGMVVAPGDVDGLAHAIRSLAADPHLTHTLGHRARAAYRDKYTLDRAVAAFRALWHLP
jgi:colanic acid biosynthesis glycosyl transferase WcaI